MNHLDRFIDTATEEFERRKRECPLADLERLIREAGPRRPFSEALSRPGTSVIAEHKRRSPSKGEIQPNSNVTSIVSAYERGGAAALSILTAERYFGGRLTDLQAARAGTDLPILRKDFIVDPYQVWEAAAFGADAILLVVAGLDRARLDFLYHEARQLDLDVLVEVRDEEQLGLALEVDVDVIGINNRDLATLSMDVDRTPALLAEVPAGKIVVAESGIDSRSTIEEMERVGVDAFLVGHTLMEAADPEGVLRELSHAEEPTQA